MRQYRPKSEIVSRTSDTATTVHPVGMRLPLHVRASGNHPNDTTTTQKRDCPSARLRQSPQRYISVIWFRYCSISARLSSARVVRTCLEKRKNLYSHLLLRNTCQSKEVYKSHVRQNIMNFRCVTKYHIQGEIDLDSQVKPMNIGTSRKVQKPKQA